MRKKGKVILFTLSMALVSSGAFAQIPSDITSHWAEGQIKQGLEKGWVKGYPDGMFKPNQPITRAEFVTMVNQAFQFTETSDVPFHDVPAKSWYAQEVMKARAAGYISGYRDGTFKPTTPVSRQEAAVIIGRLMGLPEEPQAANQFSDVLPDWSRGAIGAVVSKGVMKGFTTGTFLPYRSLTRAELIKILDLVVEKLSVVETTSYDKAGIYGPKEGKEVFGGNLVLDAAGITIQNLIVQGNLTITKNVGEGEITLRNIKVNGKTIVRGGGPQSIHLVDTELGEVEVNKEKGKVRLAASGSSEINRVHLLSPSDLQEHELKGKGFDTVVVSDSVPKGSTLMLTGEYDTVEIYAEGITVNIPNGSKVKKLILHSKVKIDGMGNIENATILANGVSFAKKPNQVVLGNGITLVYYDEDHSSSGDDGGSSGQPPSETWKEAPAFVLTNILKGAVETGKADEIRIFHQGQPLGLPGQYMIEGDGEFNFVIDGAEPLEVYEIKLYKNGTEISGTQKVVTRLL